MKKHLTRWYIKYPGAPYAWGPLTELFANEREVREAVRRIDKVKRLPRGMQFWRAS